MTSDNALQPKKLRYGDWNQGTVPTMLKLFSLPLHSTSHLSIKSFLFPHKIFHISFRHKKAKSSAKKEGESRSNEAMFAELCMLKYIYPRYFHWLSFVSDYIHFDSFLTLVFHSDEFLLQSWLGSLDSFHLLGIKKAYYRKYVVLYVVGNS